MNDAQAPARPLSRFLNGAREDQARLNTEARKAFVAVCHAWHIDRVVTWLSRRSSQ